MRVQQTGGGVPAAGIQEKFVHGRPVMKVKNTGESGLDRAVSIPQS